MKLQVGDTFRKPSTNTHDNGFREYRVVSIETEHPGGFKATLAFTIRDQHGYQSRISFATWKVNGSQEFMRSAAV